MTDAEAAAAREDALRRTLVVGGALLIASAVLGFAGPSMLSMTMVLNTVVFWGGTLAFSAALVVYAVGLGRAGSIVARRPLGVGAMVLLAARPLVERNLTLLYPVSEESSEFYLTWGWISVAVRLAAASVIVVQIARAGVIRGRLRWAPLWALVAVVAPQVVAQLLVAASGIDLGRTEDDGIWLFFGLGQLAAFAAPVVLGILSIVYAQRRAAHTSAEPVQVYPPEA